MYNHIHHGEIIENWGQKKRLSYNFPERKKTGFISRNKDENGTILSSKNIGESNKAVYSKL